MMDDTISRQAAIDEINKYILSFDAMDANFLDGLRTAIKIIKENFPSAKQWIPFSERLPEKSGRYLVTRGLNACGSLWNRIYIANYSDLMGIKSDRIWWQGNVGKSDFERLDDVIAWMPLPEPYKGEES